MNNYINKENKFLEKCKTLPNLPGVYLMKNISEEIIYIGKAKNLKNRVSSYFLNESSRTSKVEKMVDNIENFDYIITDSEFEALILECSLIKKYQPKYNILLKDSKGYSYIKITDEIWPRIWAVKQKIEDGNLYIGPYISSATVKNTVEEIIKIFKLPDCKRNLEKIYKNPCLNYYINRCSAPCVRKISCKEYNKVIEEAKYFLKNGINKTLLDLKKGMNEASDAMDFETAAKIRDKIKSIEKIKSSQKVVSRKTKFKDVIALSTDDSNTSIEVFRYSQGDLYKSKNFILASGDDEIESRTQFLKQFYQTKEDIPETIILDGDINDFDLIKKFLSNKKGTSVKLEIPKRGDLFKLSLMCKRNAYENLLKSKGFKTKEEFYLEDLKNILNLQYIPNRIESYDISNLSGYDCVGSMIVFENGKPLKSHYRKFRLDYSKDDYFSIKSVLKRRFSRYENSNKNESFNKFPDLILVDGGKGHVRATKEAISEMGVNVPVFGIVKDSKHRTRALVTDLKELKIKENTRLFLFITQIQDEVHRYAINYHRNLRNKKVKTSELLNIKGIGEKRSRELLKHFGSLSEIKKESLESIESVKSMDKKSAEAVYNYFHDIKN